MLRFILVACVVTLPLGASGEPPKGKAELLVEEGRRQLAEDDPKAAEQTFQQAITAAPAQAIGYNELGVALFQQKRYAEAAEQFERATKLDPQLAHAWANLAEARRLAGGYKLAALAYHRFLQLEKGDRYAVYGLALCFEGYEQFDKALRTLQVAEQAAGGDARLLARISAAYQRVRRKMSEADMSLLERGDAHLTAGRWEEAMNLYQQGLETQPNDAALLGRRGLLHAILGDLGRARGDLEAALMIDAREPVARAAYGLVLDAAGDTTASKPPQDGTALLRADRAAAALRAFEAALQARPGHEPSLAGRGESHLRLGALDAAQQDFTAAGDKAGLAEVFLVRGAEPEAREAAGAANVPVPLEQLPVWRRSLILNGGG